MPTPNRSDVATRSKKDPPLLRLGGRSRVVSPKGMKLFNFRGEKKKEEKKTALPLGSIDDSVYGRFIKGLSRENVDDNSGKLSRVYRRIEKHASKLSSTVCIWGSYYASVGKPFSLNPNKNVPLFDGFRYDIFIRIKRDRLPPPVFASIGLFSIFFSQTSNILDSFSREPRVITFSDLPRYCR